MRYIEKSRQRNKGRIRIALALNFTLFMAGLIGAILGILTIENNPKAGIVLILAGILGVTAVFKNEEAWGDGSSDVDI